MWLFLEGPFLIFRSKVKLLMEPLSNELFFKLVLMYLKWFECFLKDFGSLVQQRC